MHAACTTCCASMRPPVADAHGAPRNTIQPTGSGTGRCTEHMCAWVTCPRNPKVLQTQTCLPCLHGLFAGDRLSMDTGTIPASACKSHTTGRDTSGLLCRCGCKTHLNNTACCQADKHSLQPQHKLLCREHNKPPHPARSDKSHMVPHMVLPPATSRTMLWLLSTYTEQHPVVRQRNLESRCVAQTVYKAPAAMRCTDTCSGM